MNEGRFLIVTSYGGDKDLDVKIEKPTKGQENPQLTLSRNQYKQSSTFHKKTFCKTLCLSHKNYGPLIFDNYGVELDKKQATFNSRTFS